MIDDERCTEIDRDRGIDRASERQIEGE